MESDDEVVKWLCMHSSCKLLQATEWLQSLFSLVRRLSAYGKGTVQLLAVLPDHSLLLA